MMKTKNKSKFLTEKEKQVQPMSGETPPKEAFIKARQFAIQEHYRLMNSKCSK